MFCFPPENTRMEIEGHDADDTYVKTSAVTAAIDLLRTKNLLIIIGKAGIGKSSTALAIASAFHAKVNMVMKLEHNLAKDFKRYYNRRFKQLIILEDFLGQSDLQYCSKKHANILDVLAPHVHHGISKFIITTRTYKILDAADEIIKCHKLFSNCAIINLNGEFSLSTTEKENILKLHAIKHKINICKKYNTKTLGSKILHYNEFENIIGTDPYLGFPEACHLFCSFDNLFAMGYKFFSSPSEKLLDEIRELRITGYDQVDVALQYCVLTSLMLDNVCKISIGIRKGIIPCESHESLNNLLNINCSMIEFLYRLLYKKEITVTTNDVHDICNKVSEKYVTKEFDRKKYVFLHSTVRDAVLLSYWHKATMDDIIKYCSVDILLEYVRTWDCTNKGHGWYLFVPKSKCKTLVQRLFDICLVCKGAIILCSIVIEKSEFTLNLLNQKLTEWCCTEANVINCGLSKLKKFIRPARYKNENNRPCAHADENWVIARLINELKKLDCQVKFVRFYIQYYGCNDFVQNFNTKLTHWLKFDTNVENCKWKVFKECVRPKTFKIEKGKMRAAVEDTWIVKRLIHELMTITFDGIFDVIWYIKKYGCKEFIRNFNETFSQWLKLELNLMSCKWIVVSEIVRPLSFKIDSGKIYAHTDDNLLSQRLISELMKNGGDRILDVQTYIQKFCRDNFVKDFNKHLTAWLQSEKNVVNIELNVLYKLVRPKSFKIASGEIRGYTNDNWLSQRLIKEFLKTGGDRITDVQTYIKKYGSNTFVTIFTENLAEWLQTEENVVNCELNVLYEFVCPTSFKIGSGEIRAHSNDNWLAQRLLDQLLVEVSESKLSDVHRYIKKYGSDKFVKILNKNFTKWLQSRENLIHCKLNVLYELVRPSSFRIENGIIGASTNDTWLTEILINQLLKPEVCSIWKERSYIKTFGNDDFIRSFNKKLTERLQLHATVKHCKWVVIFELVRPSSFKIESGEIGATTDDNWLTQRLISELVSPGAKLVLFVIDYIKKFGSKQFVNDFNTNLTIWLQSVENVNKSKWDLLFQTISPMSGTIETGGIEVPTTESWIIQRLVHGLVESEFEMENVRRSIENYGSEYFNRCFNFRLHAWILKHLKTCKWQLFIDVVRPLSFSKRSDYFTLCVDDIQVVEYLFERLHHRSDAFFIKRYIQKYGSDEFIVKFNKMLQTKLNDVGEETTWERLEHFYKNSPSRPITPLFLSFSDEGDKKSVTSSSFFTFSKTLSRIRHSKYDFEYVKDDHRNSNDDFEDSTYETDEYFDSSSDSDLGKYDVSKSLRYQAYNLVQRTQVMSA